MCCAKHSSTNVYLNVVTYNEKLVYNFHSISISSNLRSTERVKRSVIVCYHVATDAAEFVIKNHRAPHVDVLVTYSVASMGLAIIFVLILALLVLSHATGVVNTPLPCGAPCNRRLCDRRCTKSLTCGHQCPSICGEDCPSEEFCHLCGTDDVKERVADVILFQTYGEIDPTEDPVLILPCCSMVYTMATLDGTLHVSTYYNENGYPRGAIPGGYIDMPQCPNCNKPIRGIRRYGRITKRAAIDAAEKKFIVHAQRQLTVLQGRVNAAVDQGDLTNDKMLHQNLRCFGTMVKRPPCQKIFEACVALLNRSEDNQSMDVDMSTIPVPNSTFRFVGYYNLLSAQLRLLGVTPIISKAETYAREALKHFLDGSYSQQACEAKLVLMQILLMQAHKTLNEPVKTEEDHTKREDEIKPIVSE
ncbi:hypothetical protein PHMEG_00023356, partial [Phytophthora megakarya]